ncbi:MAG: hypothetical protein M0R46_06455 [Candidatus Muirbacterium halophilum]|nr:hypothetical protein [Candidatus Muirbacterium halophilum]
MKYKEKLENELLDIEYLYSGDVKTENPIHYYEKYKITDNNKLDKIFIKEIIIDIYEKSIQQMKDRAIVIITNNDKLSNVNSIIVKNNINSNFIFVDKKYRKIILNMSNIQTNRTSHILPRYFFKLYEEANIYLCPIIKIISYENDIYLVDKPIQSMVYVLQNMRYEIKKVDDKWKHIIKYDLFDCIYTSYKIVLRDMQKYRNKQLKCLK